MITWEVIAWSICVLVGIAASVALWYINPILWQPSKDEDYGRYYD